MKTLLDKCFEALGNNFSRLTEKDAMAFEELFIEILPTEIYGINWSLLKAEKWINDQDEIPQEILNDRCFVMWDEASKPIILSQLCFILENINDVTAVAFDTWIVGQNFEWFLENHHEKGLRFTFL